MRETQRFQGGPHDGETVPAGLNRTTLQFLVAGEPGDEWVHTYTLFAGGVWRYMGVLNRDGLRAVPRGVE